MERDFTVYGDECKFGGGKTIREGMGQASGVSTEKQLDTVIINALIIDYTGIASLNPLIEILFKNLFRYL